MSLRRGVVFAVLFIALVWAWPLSAWGAGVGWVKLGVLVFSLPATAAILIWLWYFVRTSRPDERPRR